MFESRSILVRLDDELAGRLSRLCLKLAGMTKSNPERLRGQIVRLAIDHLYDTEFPTVPKKGKVKRVR